MIDPSQAHPILLADGSAHKGTVFLSAVIDNPKFDVGAFTYASAFDPPDDWASRLAPYLFPFSQESLRIGRFCQIADGVKFITSSANHATRGPSTFPFAVFDEETRAGYQPDTRDTIVGHDVWFGYGAMVMPGARIGNGVIVGAGAVVRGSIPDYSVVSGNPATVARKRYEQADIDRLNALAWWNWPIAQILNAKDVLSTGDISGLEAYAP